MCNKVAVGAALADVDDDDFKMEASNLLALKDSLADALVFHWEAVDDAAWQRVDEQMEIVMTGSYTSNGNIYHMVGKDNAKLNVASVAYCLVEVLIKDKPTALADIPNLDHTALRAAM